MTLSVQNISKTYANGVKALDQVNFEISSGMFGLLGPNGAGKSTLMRAMATLQVPDSGQIIFNGQDIFFDKPAYRQHLGYLPQEFGVYPRESARRLLDYFALLKGISSKRERAYRVDQVLEATNLSNDQDKNVRSFSGGMRQRFGIAQLLLNQPKVIIVDEPTAGLDPAERVRFLNILRNIGSENIVVFSTHLVEDVKALCNDMAVLNDGKVLATAPPLEATESLRGKIWETELREEELIKLGIPFKKLSDRYNEHNRLVSRIYAAQQPSSAFTPALPSLEDFYFITLHEA